MMEKEGDRKGEAPHMVRLCVNHPYALPAISTGFQSRATSLTFMEKMTVAGQLSTALWARGENFFGQTADASRMEMGPRV